MYDVSVHILARSLSPSVRTATTTDTNWFSCHAAEVTQTTWAQTRGLPFSGPLRSLLGTLAEQCACIAGVATMCDACLVNTENHYLELSSLRHSLQEAGGGDNYQLKPDFTGRSITRIQAPRDFTRDPETLPAAVAASISSISLEKQQLAHVCVSACMCLHEPAVQTYTINSTGKNEIVV